MLGGKSVVSRLIMRWYFGDDELMRTLEGQRAGRPSVASALSFCFRGERVLSQAAKSMRRAARYVGIARRLALPTGGGAPISKAARRN